jgi:hypothetical protein
MLLCVLSLKILMIRTRRRTDHHAIPDRLFLFFSIPVLISVFAPSMDASPARLPLDKRALRATADHIDLHTSATSVLLLSICLGMPDRTHWTKSGQTNEVISVLWQSHTDCHWWTSSSESKRWQFIEFLHVCQTNWVNIDFAFGDKLHYGSGDLLL